MTPTLAMFETVFGPAPTLLGIAIGLCWIWCIWKKYPLNKPFLRLFAVLEMCVVLSMALGFNDTFADRFKDGGGYGGWIGRLIAEPILQLNLPLLTGIVITLLVVAALASIILATEWLGIPLFFRLQQMDPAFANTGYVGTLPQTPFAPRSDEPMKRSVVEDESTADPLVSFGGSSDTATATLDRDETAPSTYSPPQGVLGRRTRHDDEVMPPSISGETIAPDETEDAAGTPWYARRRARREAERAEREARETRDEPIEETPRAERRSRYSSDFEREPTFDEPAPAPAPSEFDSTESQAATSDLEDRLAESVDFAAPTAEPIAEAQRADIVAPPVEDSILEAPAPERAREVAPAPQPIAEDRESQDKDSFADFFGGVSEALAAPPAAEPAREDELASTPNERVIEPVAEMAPEPVAEPIPEAPAAPIAAESPTAPDEPVRAVASDDPEQQLFLAAGDAVVTGQRASISFLQRSLSIGYFQAAKLLDRLEREGVIGPYTGAVSRNVLMDPATWSRHKNG